jgi:hypothetical protein
MTRPVGGFLNYTPVTSQQQAAAVWSLYDALGKIAAFNWPLQGAGFRYILVAGGGGGGRASTGTSAYTDVTGGGGAGGVLFGTYFFSGTLSATVTIGGGGSGINASAATGSVTSLGLPTPVSASGGGGGGNPTPASGGSGGGGGITEGSTAGTYNTSLGYPGTTGQGNRGADPIATSSTQTLWIAGGGGGAGEAATDKNGGAGIDLAPFIGTSYLVGGGGGGSSYNNNGGSGIGGTGGGGSGIYNAVGNAGSVNTGGGGGGTGAHAASLTYLGGAGGSGVAFIIYPTAPFISTSGGTLSNITLNGEAFSVRRFNATGTLSMSN